MQVSSPSVRPLALDLCTSRQSTVSLAEDTPSKQVSEGSGKAPAMITISVLCDISHLKGTSQSSGTALGSGCASGCLRVMVLPGPKLCRG